MYKQDYYNMFFADLLKIVKNNNIDVSVAESIKCHAMQFEKHWHKNDFSNFGDKHVRQYIGRDKNLAWEAIVMCWKKGNKTLIHGHPDFASYTGLSGKLMIEVFTPTEIPNQCKKVSEQIVENGFSTYAIGEPGVFTNHIHRISCLSDYAHTLHIYSNDALQGQVYELI